MYSILPKATHAALFGASILGASILLGGSGIDCAIADVFRVQLNGTFTSAEENPPFIKPGTPFTGAFYVDTSAPGIVSQNIGNGVTAVGYQAAAISGLAISAGGVTFTNTNIAITPILSSTASVFFSQALANGAAPSIVMVFGNGTYGLGIGGILDTTFSSCIPGAVLPCSFNNSLFFGNVIPLPTGVVNDEGTVMVTVTGFAGTPLAPNCHDQSTAALAKKYTGMANAAKALGYPSVMALQNVITVFCGG